MVLGVKGIVDLGQSLHYVSIKSGILKSFGKTKFINAGLSVGSLF